MTVEFEQIPFSATEFAENPEPRCPCLLLLDTSGSMAGNPIAQLNGGIKVFDNEVRSDSLAARRVEVAIISFGPVKEELDFTTANNFFPPELHASGGTPMGEAACPCEPRTYGRPYCQQEGSARRAGSMRARSELQLQAIRNEASATKASILSLSSAGGVCFGPFERSAFNSTKHFDTKHGRAIDLRITPFLGIEA
jgi:hypothetical protein